jgi:transcriptional regulator
MIRTRLYTDDFEIYTEEGEELSKTIETVLKNFIETTVNQYNSRELETLIFETISLMIGESRIKRNNAILREKRENNVTRKY